MISTAESCTGGNIAHTITLIPGSSAAFAGGIVSYSNEVKMLLLGVKEETLAENGAVSIPVVEEMAKGALTATDTQIAMATSGIAGPGGGTPDKPVGTVCIAVATADGLCRATVAKFNGSRIQVIESATLAALQMALRATK
ncbi:MAG: CinA family protein [Duncaniella sp.]|nr:CinA family protein [Muribaculum sp.]MCM1254700.1 CinA family protein [Duncaniella sp.]